ncbi:MAG: four helix bundle protein [Candidatus Pacearchaeota archaeon]
MIYHLDMSKAEELEERLKNYSLETLGMIKKLPRTEENRIYRHQLVRSSSSIGANYAEARYAHSLQDFIHTLNICRREANESLYWLGMILATNPSFTNEINNLINEGKQLLKIFISSVKTAKDNKK